MQLVHEPSLSALPADVCLRVLDMLTLRERLEVPLGWGSGARSTVVRRRAWRNRVAERYYDSEPSAEWSGVDELARARVAYHLLRTRDVVNLGQADRGWNFAFVGAERSVRVGREADALTRAHLFSWARRFREFTIWLDDTRSFHNATMDQLVARRPGTGIAIRLYIGRPMFAHDMRQVANFFATLPPCERVGRDWVDLKANVDLARKSALYWVMAGLLPRHGLDEWAEHIFVTLHATAWPFPFPDPHY